MRQHLDKDFVLKYCPSGQMLADGLTKALDAPQHTKLNRQLVSLENGSETFVRQPFLDAVAAHIARVAQNPPAAQPVRKLIRV